MRMPILALVSLSLLAGCHGGKDAAKDGKAAVPEETAAHASIAVEIKPAATGAIAQETTLSADIRALREAKVAAKVGGRLESLSVDEGSNVKAGQVIGRIDPRDYELQALQAKTSLATALASRASAITRLRKSQDDLKRFGVLHREGGISDQQMVATRSEAEANRNAVASAEAQIEQARATIAIAEKSVADTVIRAPFGGVISQKSTEIGTMLSPSTPLVSIAAVDTLELKVPVGQSALGSIKIGQAARFSVPTYPGKTFAAKVAEVAPTIDPRTRTAEVTIRIPNGDRKFSPGMFARVIMPTAVREAATLVPPIAVLTEGDSQYVYIVKGEKAERRKVEVGIRTQEKVEIAAGLTAGEPVVVLGQGQLQPGDKVHVVEKTAK